MQTTIKLSAAQSLVWFGWALFAAHGAAAQDITCHDYFGCPEDMDCDHWTYYVCVAPEDVDCHFETPNKCFPSFIRECETDSDCGPYFTCNDLTRPTCGFLGTGGGAAPAPTDDGTGGTGEKCHDFTRKLCKLGHTLCTSDADCDSEGFVCQIDPSCPPFYPAYPGDDSDAGGLGAGGSFAAQDGSGGAPPPFDAGSRPECDRICAPRYNPFLPPFIGSGGADGGGGSGAGGDTTGPGNGAGGMASMSGAGGASSMSGAGGASGDSHSHGPGHQHDGYRHWFGCAVSDGDTGARSGQWFALVWVAALGLRRRARRQPARD